MSMTMIIIISLLVLNLSLTLIMFWNLYSALEAIKSLQDSENILKKVLDLNNQLIEKYNKYLDNVYERETTIHDAVISLMDNTKEVSFQLTDLANVSTEDEYYLTLQEACDTVCIDCPYDQCLKDGDCPVYKIMHKDDIPDGIEGETPPDPEEMKEFFETNGFKNIREKVGDS